MKTQQSVLCDNCNHLVETNGIVQKYYNVMEAYYANHFIRKHICLECSKSVNHLEADGYAIVIQVYPNEHFCETLVKVV